MQRFLNISISNNSRIIDTLSLPLYDLNFILGITAKAQPGPINKMSMDFNTKDWILKKQTEVYSRF